MHRLRNSLLGFALGSAFLVAAFVPWFRHPLGDRMSVVTLIRGDYLQGETLARGALVVGVLAAAGLTLWSAISVVGFLLGKLAGPATQPLSRRGGRGGRTAR